MKYPNLLLTGSGTVCNDNKHQHIQAHCVLTCQQLLRVQLLITSLTTNSKAMKRQVGMKRRIKMKDNATQDRITATHVHIYASCTWCARTLRWSSWIQQVLSITIAGHLELHRSYPGCDCQGCWLCHFAGFCFEWRKPQLQHPVLRNEHFRNGSSPGSKRSPQTRAVHVPGT